MDETLSSTLDAEDAETAPVETVQTATALVASTPSPGNRRKRKWPIFLALALLGYIAFKLSKLK